MSEAFVHGAINMLLTVFRTICLRLCLVNALRNFGNICLAGSSEDSVLVKRVLSLLQEGLGIKGLCVLSA
jgi:hypothetical protein